MPTEAYEIRPYVNYSFHKLLSDSTSSFQKLLGEVSNSFQIIGTISKGFH